MNAKANPNEMVKADRNAAAMVVLQAFVMAQKSHTITRRMAIEAYLGADVLMEVSRLTSSELKTELNASNFAGLPAP